MFRTCIFCYYDKNGQITDDIPVLLSELKKICEFMIIVVNGELWCSEKFQRFADKIIIRENKGYDAAAYKTALADLECSKIIENSDELIFCNSSFWGSFIPFESIFNIMDKRGNIDFWGLGLIDNGFYTFLQSYFLVYRKSVIDSHILVKYFERYIKRDFEYYDVCYYFERELFKHLVDSGYKYDAFITVNNNVYSDLDKSICCDKLPILKKKVFSDKFYNKEKLLNSLKYVGDHYDYDIKIILDTARHLYGSEITLQDVKDYELPSIEPEERIKTNKRTKDILEFAERYPAIYIYGTGAYADNFTRMIDKDRILGYIVSDDQKIENSAFKDKPIYKFSQMSQKRDIPILVALGAKNTLQVIDNLVGYENVFYLWDFPSGRM